MFNTKNDKVTQNLVKTPMDSIPIVPIILYNPTPIHPKAQDIITFQTALSSVVIHIPTKNPENNYFKNSKNNLNNSTIINNSTAYNLSQEITI